MMPRWLPNVDHSPLTHDGRLVNISSRGGTAIDAIVLHYTAGGHYMSSHRWFCFPEARASAHFLIGREGQICQCVPLDKKAWHAGDGEMLYQGEMARDPNRFSVGIEIANYGLLEYDGRDWFYEMGGLKKRYKAEKYGTPVKASLEYDTGLVIDGWWEPYRGAQIDAVVKLCNDLVKRGIPLNRIVGHEDTALPIGRKKDPGPLFPWRQFQARLNGPEGDGTNYRRTKAHHE